MAEQAIDPNEEEDLPLDPVDDTETDAESPDDSTVEADEEVAPDNPDEVAAPADDRQPPPRQPQPSRGERRFQALSGELAKERQAREEMARRLDAALAGQQRQQVQETPEARAQRLALLTPEERITRNCRTRSRRFRVRCRSFGSNPRTMATDRLRGEGDGRSVVRQVAPEGRGRTGGFAQSGHERVA